jgi:hypothetical protein
MSLAPDRPGRVGISMTIETLAELIETRHYERFIELGTNFCFCWAVND